MTETQPPQFIEVGDDGARRRIATLAAPGGQPGFIWLPGLKSEMISTKATALAEWAAARHFACTRFDYSGHGQSGGRFEDGTIGQWLEEAEAVFTRLTEGPQILVGSSTGGHIALLLLRRLQQTAPELAERIAGLVLIAPAWDLTEELMWKRFDDAARNEITTNGVWYRPSAYGDPYAITRNFIEEGRNHLLAREPWDPGVPVEIIQGKLDVDVPWQHAQALTGFLIGGHTRITYVPDGEHRLSRPEDLELLFKVIERMTAPAKQS